MGQRLAETPEALMRSRYTAFTQANVDYLFASMAPDLAPHVDREEMQTFVNSVKEWSDLEISDAPHVSEQDIHGVVEFVAQFVYQGKKQRIHERSTFTKINGQWFYSGHEHQCGSHDHNHDHHHHKHQPTQQPYEAGEKTGRNDPCPCGSGKKYKKCCLE